MRKFKRIYHAVLLLTVILLITVSNQIGAIDNVASRNKVLYGVWAYDTTAPRRDTIPTNNDTIPSPDSLLTDTIPPTDSSIVAGNSRIDTFTLKISKDTLSAPVTYQAEDSVVGMVQAKTIELYGKAKVDYERSSLEAPYMKLNQSNSIVMAKASRDSLGEIAEYVKMKDGESDYQSDSLQYNFKTQKGIIRGTITQQGEMFLHSEIAKKVDSNTVYALGNFFTTCNLDHPHFGFRAKRAKIVNKKLAVTGAVRPEFDSVPVPIYLPFGFYPLYQGRHSGALAPSFETNDQEGVGLSGMGYYYVINDYWDVRVYGDIYSYGTWRAFINPTYRKLYKYQGQMTFSIQSTQRNVKGDPDYYKSRTYSLNWNHSSDSRARPGVSFSASVNASSTGYNRNLSNIPLAPYNNVLNSSITYSKQWQDKPFSLSLGFNHSQNNSTRLMTLNLPTANFTVSTLYPFQKKDGVGTRKWYEQLGIGYTGSFRNDFNFYDSVSYSKSNERIGGRRIYEFLWDTARWSANHSIPITLSLPPILGGAIMISPSVSYSQEWVDRITTLSWGPKTFYVGDSSYVKDTLIADYQRAFKIKHQTSFGISFNTALYGTYQFKSPNVIALRHVIRPTLGLSYTPDLTRNFWKPVQIDSAGTIAVYNQLEGLYSRPMSQFTSRRSGGINFGLDNNLELKVRNKKKKSTSQNASSETGEDTDDDASSDSSQNDDTRKIKLIDGFGFSGSYNFLADSLKLSPISMYFRTNLFDKINLNASATLVPYKLNEYGNAINEYAWAGKGFKIGTITNASISMSTSFQSKPKDPAKAKAREEEINKRLNDPMLQADQMRLLEFMQQNPAEFVDFNTDWSFSLSFSLSYSRQRRSPGYQQSGAKPVNSSINFNGGFNLTPKWNLSMTGYYDFTTNQVQTLSMAISRDLHCWQMSINVTPIGLYRFFNITISPKAGILQDLKINRTRSFTSY